MNGLVGGMIKTKPRNASGGPRNRTPDERLKRSRTQMPGIAYVYPAERHFTNWTIKG